MMKITDYDYFLNKILNISEDKLKRYISEKNKDDYYKRFFLLDKKTGKRKVYCVNKLNPLYSLQKDICVKFLNNIPLSNDVYGFVKGNGYVDYLEPHKSNEENVMFLRLDIKSFFTSIKPELIKEVFEFYIDIKEKNKAEEILNIIYEIITYKGELVQGAVTSPIVSNIIFRQLDIRIQRYCSKLDIRYTRYADDMLFSSKNKILHSNIFIGKINQILMSKDFNLNYRKTIKTKDEISLNGYVIGKDIRIARKKLKEISEILYLIEQVGSNNIFDRIFILNTNIKNINNKRKNKEKECKHFNSNYELINYLTGQRAFIISVLKYSKDRKFIKKANNIIERIEKKVLEFYKLF